MLGPDLRHMVYTYLLRFPRIRVGSKAEVSISEPHRNGSWLQRNPHHNPLTPLMVSRQFYHETRRVFYGLNTFAFGGVEVLVVFLIGIGRRNAMLLRSVCWGADCLYENRADVLRSCVAQEGSTDTERPNIWNDKTHYAHFLETFNTNPHSNICPRGNNEYCRLFRLDMSDSSTRDIRNRYKLFYFLQEHDKHGERHGKGRVSFDLYSRTEEVLL